MESSLLLGCGLEECRRACRLDAPLENQAETHQVQSHGLRALGRSVFSGSLSLSGQFGLYTRFGR
jgi:hypothetical protein